MDVRSLLRIAGPTASTAIASLACALWAQSPEQGQQLPLSECALADDAVRETIPVTIRHEGNLKRALVHADRNGYFYAIDQTNGTRESGPGGVKQ